MQAEAGKTCKGKVTKITKFGAFIRLEDGSNGLVHISQVSDAYVSDVQEYLTVGQEVEPRILSIDEKGRISLTLKREKEDPSRYGPQPAQFQSSRRSSDLEEMIDRFKTVSEEKLGELRRLHSRKR